MKLVAAATLWCLFSGLLVFPHLGVPALLRTATATLMWLELLAALTWGFASEGCARRPCGPLAETARAAAGLDIPALSLVLLGLVIAHGLRGRRLSARRRGDVRRTRHREPSTPPAATVPAPPTPLGPSGPASRATPGASRSPAE